MTNPTTYQAGTVLDPVNGPVPVIVTMYTVTNRYPGPVVLQMNPGFSYTMAQTPPGIPNAPGLTGSANPSRTGQTFGAGATLPALLEPEAEALTKLGAATVLAYL
jgi:hypothetical protein